MDKKKAEKARNLLMELSSVQEIKEATEKEEQNWWAFLAPNIQILKEDGLVMPGTLREEFTKAVDRSIERLNKQIEEL